MTNRIEVGTDVLSAHRELAAANRDLLERHGVTMVDIMGSVGSGKTSLIEQLVTRLPRVAVLHGDLTTSIDRDRVARCGAPAVQINTGRGCHLDAEQVGRGLETLELPGLDLVLVENVGNLICPAGFELGSHLRLVVIGATEGPYVVVKHPHVFAAMDGVVINKMDLAPALGFDADRLARDLDTINPHLRVFRISCVTGQGIDEVAGFITGDTDA